MCAVKYQSRVSLRVDIVSPSIRIHMELFAAAAASNVQKDSVIIIDDKVSEPSLPDLIIQFKLWAWKWRNKKREVGTSCIDAA